MRLRTGRETWTTVQSSEAYKHHEVEIQRAMGSVPNKTAAALYQCPDHFRYVGKHTKKTESGSFPSHTVQVQVQVQRVPGPMGHGCSYLGPRRKPSTAFPLPVLTCTPRDFLRPSLKLTNVVLIADLLWMCLHWNMKSPSSRGRPPLPAPGLRHRQETLFRVFWLNQHFSTANETSSCPDAQTSPLPRDLDPEALR